MDTVLLKIPSGASPGEVIDLRSDELPDAAAEVLSVLQHVQAPLASWVDVAAEYFRQRKFAQFEAVFRETFAADVSAARHYQGVESHAARVRMLVAAASYELLAGSGATGGFDVASRAGKDKRQLAAARLQAAEQHLNSAVKLSHGAGGVHASLCAAAKAALALQSALVASPTDERAQAHLAALAGLAADAESAFARDKSTRELASATGAVAVSASIAFVPVLLAQAAARFATGDFAGARALYARVVREAPAVAAAPVRTALGICLHKLGYAEAARAAFSRALQLQPDAPLALTYLAALESARLVAAAATTAAAAPAAAKGAASNGGPAATSAVAAPAPLEAAASEIRLRARVHEMLRRATDAAAATAGAGAGSAATATSTAATSALAGLPAQTLLELSHSAFERFAPLTTAPAGGAPEPVTAAVTLGSRWVVFSADVRKVVGKSETLRFLVRKPAASGAAATPVAVPLRLVGAQPVTLVAASALAPLSVAHPFLQGLEPGTLVCVGKARSPWPFPSATGVPVTGIDVERALAFAKAALEAAQTVEVRAEAHYALARASHAKASYVDAGIEYRNCLTLRPDFAPAVYGNAQVAVTGKRPDDAAALLGRVLAARPDDRSALRTLAFLRMQTPGAQAEALESARRAYDAAPADAVAAALYAMQLARQDTPHAIARAYKVVESIGERQTRAGLHVPAAVHNNCGVLAMRQAAHEATLSARRKLLALAEEQLMRGVEVVALEMLPGATAAQRATQEVRGAALFSAAGLTLAFNLARLDEVQGRVGTAEAAYRRILEAAPHYFDANLRLGILAQDRGDLAAASANFAATAETAKSAASATGDKGAQQQALSASATAFCLLGRVRELQGDAPGAKHAYSAAMDLPGFAGDPYPSLATANLAFRDVYSVEEGAREPILRACFDAFKDVLKRFPHSLYAANGLGMILAEQGRLEAAQDVFAHVREANPEALQPTVNLALTQVALGNTASALQLFAHAQRKAIAAPTAAASSGMPATGGGSAAEDAASAEHVRLLSYEARAHMEARSFGSALVALARAASLSPHDMRVKYNLSFAQAEDALRVLGMDPSQRTAAQVESAVENLRCAARGFQWLQSTLESLQRDLTAAEEETAATKAGGAASSASAEHRAARLRARIAALGVPRERVATFVAHVQGTLPAAEAHLADARLRASKATAEAAERAAFLTARAAAKAAEEAAATAENDRKREAARAAARQLQSLLQERPQAGADGGGAPPAADTDDGIVGGKRKKKAVKPRVNAKRRRVGEDDDGARASSPGGSSTSSSSSSSSSDSDSDSDSSSDSGSGTSSPDRSAAAVRAVFGDDAEEMVSEAKGSRDEAVPTDTIEDLFGAEED